MEPAPTPPGTANGIPISRLVAFLTPVLATISASAATWLLTHVHFLSLFHVGGDQLAQGILQGIIWLVVFAAHWALGHKWLDGLSKWERGVIADYPGDNSGVMPIMPPPGDVVPNDASGMADDPNAGEGTPPPLPDGEGTHMPLGWDPSKGGE